MNIFFLDLDPKKNAKYYYNKHCVKIILEVVQMLYTAHWVLQKDSEWLKQKTLKPYKKAHINHPTCKWIRQKKENYLYSCTLCLELCKEYTNRYQKIHKSQAHLEWLRTNLPTFPNELLPIQGFLATESLPFNCSPVPLAMPSNFHSPDLLFSYRMYYLIDKFHIKDSTEQINNLIREWKLEEEVKVLSF